VFIRVCIFAFILYFLKKIINHLAIKEKEKIINHLAIKEKEKETDLA
jgi:hypothetical protein